MFVEALGCWHGNVWCCRLMMPYGIISWYFNRLGMAWFLTVFFMETQIGIAYWQVIDVACPSSFCLFFSCLLLFFFFSPPPPPPSPPPTSCSSDLVFIFLVVLRGTTQNGGQATCCLQRPVGWKLLLQLVTLVPGFGHMARNPALLYIRVGDTARHHKHMLSRMQPYHGENCACTCLSIGM